MEYQKALQLRDLIPVLVVCGVYAALLLSGITCPIKQWTGISCPGCGMTRAWLSVLHGDFLRPFPTTHCSGSRWRCFRPVAAPHRKTAAVLDSACADIARLADSLFLPNDTVVTFAPQEGWLVRFLMAHL